ncbi:hypothetical protein JET14_22375 (plasmid) [Martelella lutilitoris]|uniref:Isomerase n=1 Tax=Martelella lutilitoris TaxID=2583532 RepID=A0A7T7HPN7_9HYPH|nr:hypothetical protein [Martelella lutilitoris]QQM33001.1 hypothetical protein JET14_22375 [Martelella lutilitoris]QRX65343.1 hypothetical protein JS578_13970 [Dysgonomonadaceae bacterium zrk40]
MPNVKIFVDEALYNAAQEKLVALLPDLRIALCSLLSVDNAACHLAMLPVLGLSDQPQVSVELNLLARPDRTREKIAEIAGELRKKVGNATGQPVAVRISMLDPETYVALK